MKDIPSIAVIGLNGAGKSTLAHELGKILGLFVMDAEDYYFPGQKKSRITALEGRSLTEETALKETLPFSDPVPKEEVWRRMAEHIRTYPRFIISSVTLDFGRKIISHIGAVIFIQAPAAVRLERIRSRDEKRFGSRVLPGGDMYDGEKSFLEFALSRDESVVEESVSVVDLPLLRVDGTLPLEKEIKAVLDFIDRIKTDCR